MMRWMFSLLTCLALVAAEEMPEVPAVQFRELTWWAPSTSGAYGWWPGQADTPYPHQLGRIATARIIGPQELVWNHRFYAIESVKRLDDQVVLVGFSLGTLAMRQISGLRWEVAFTPVGAVAPAGVFRTLSSLDASTQNRFPCAQLTPPDARLWQPGWMAPTGR